MWFDNSYRYLEMRGVVEEIVPDAASSCENSGQPSGTGLPTSRPNAGGTDCSATRCATVAGSRRTWVM